MDFFLYLLGLAGLILMILTLSEIQSSICGTEYKESILTKFFKWGGIRFCRHTGFCHTIHVYDNAAKYIDFDANGIIATDIYVQVKCHCTKCKKTFIIERIVHRNKWTNKVIKMIA